MMDDKDCEDYNNIGRKIPFKERFDYINGKQITDPSLENVCMR
jgi:hypothetical protein